MRRSFRKSQRQSPIKAFRRWIAIPSVMPDKDEGWIL